MAGEAKLRKEREAFEAERKELDGWREAKRLAAEGKRLAALEKLGLTLDSVQDEYLGTLKEPTPEERAEAAARKIREAEKKAEQEAREREQREAQERANNEAQASIKAASDGIEAAARALAPEEVELTAALGYSAWDVLRSFANKNGRLPATAEDHAAALRDFESDLRKRVGGTKAFTPPAAAPPPAPAPAAPQDNRTAPARDTAPQTIATSASGEVPLRSQPQRRLSAQERAAEAMRRLGIA